MDNLIHNKLKYWRDNILDLTRRNNLINCSIISKSSGYRVQRTLISISLPDIYHLWDIVDNPKKSFNIDPNIVNNQYSYRYGQFETNQSPNETIKTLKQLRTKAKTFVEEKGFSVLYVAFGFVNWQDTKGQTCHSPLILVPIEMTQSSLASPIVVKRRDDDIISNQALIQKLHREYRINLPEYGECSLDDYFAQVKDCMPSSINASIHKQVVISLFSFNKNDMYMDLVNNHDTIVSSPIVQAIAGDVSNISTTYTQVNHDTIRPQQSLTVVDADSSQQDAIALAKQGVSFVLQGPPGTGKSQTITNIIAQLLHDDKRVLFVSEKMAALDVVYSRLSDVGLKDFCLSLHSQNAKREYIVAQLHQSLELSNKRVELPKNCDADLNQLHTVKANLNSYTSQLHTIVSPLDRSIYQVYGLLSQLEDAVDVNFFANFADKISYSQLQQCIDILRQLATYLQDNGYQQDNPWRKTVVSRLSYQLQQQCSDNAIRLIQLIEEGTQLSNILNSSLDVVPEENWQHVIQLLQDILEDTSVVVPIQLVDECIGGALQLCDDWIAKDTIVRQDFGSSVYDLDNLSLQHRLYVNHKSGLRRALGGAYKNDVNILMAHSTLTAKLSYSEICSRVDNIVRAIQAKEQLDLYLQQLLPINIDDQLKPKLNRAAQLYSIATKYKLSPDSIRKLANIDDKLVDEYRQLLTQCTDWLNQYNVYLTQFASLFGNSSSIINMDLASLMTKVKLCHNNYPALDRYIQYRDIYSKAQELGIQQYIDQITLVQLDSKHIVDSFCKCVYKSWLDIIVPQYQHIDSFRYNYQQQLVSQFVKLDTGHIQYSRQLVLSRLYNKLPNIDDAASNYGEIARLRREMAKKSKRLPTRKLLALIPNLIGVFKPCMMMSPLSVSTFLDSNIKFDTVIFDEASQVRTSDAIGAIYRAKQAIIVGDNKQLPPSSFFAISSDSQDYDQSDSDQNGVNNGQDTTLHDDVDDDRGAYESLLDEAALLPSKMLRWHYRSKHESLIEFSNAKIYDGRLVTFPSVINVSNDMGVSYEYVPQGVYDRGGKSGNRIEAQRVAELVYQHFANYPNRSLGVITFGEVQKEAIEQALEHKRRQDATYEGLFGEDRQEEFFVKSLENVQGDERDSIILSIGYAQDATGKFNMNFGPLTAQGGERRLNVAITRARYDLKLVGSILSTDIRTESITHIGPKLLQLYIDYARHGSQALLGERVDNGSVQFDSMFEESVYNYLRALGYDVATQVGCSGYRIDMAVRHPNHSGRFCIGIECDGASYHSSKTARDRDRLRQSVLENMGWTIYRVWSTHWYRDQNNAKEQLKQAIDAAIAAYQEDNPYSSQVQSTAINLVHNDNPQDDIVLVPKQSSQLSKSRYYGKSPIDIPNSDWVDMLYSCAKDCNSTTKDELFRLVSLNCYGYKIVGSTIKSKLEGALQDLLDQQALYIDGDTINIHNRRVEQPIATNTNTAYTVDKVPNLNTTNIVRNDTPKDDVVLTQAESKQQDDIVLVPKQSSQLPKSRYYGQPANNVPNADFADMIYACARASYGITRDELFKLVSLHCYGWKSVGSTIKSKLSTVLQDMIDLEMLSIVDDDTIQLEDKPYSGQVQSNTTNPNE
ncbi:MAG: DUF4011 domain-containing protein [Clostridiales bacterium]|jgi:very-short-patch-repair endonuclease|nr:DUF4011 domain-containing protein [Clostridiales bacterium]